MQISVSTFFLTSLCVTCRSVYLHPTNLHSMFYMEQCIYTLLFLNMCCMQIYLFLDFTLCYLQTSVSTPLYTALCYLRSMHLHSSILHSVLHIDQRIYSFFLHSVLHVDQCIYTLLFFYPCYMQISVSKPYYFSLCVTCRSVYIHLTILHLVLLVNQCIYTVLSFTLFYMLINVSKPFLTSLCLI